MTTSQAVRDLLLSGAKMTPYELKVEVTKILKKAGSRTDLVCESSVCARTRELRRPEYGGYTVKKNKLPGRRSFEYYVELPAALPVSEPNS